MIAELLGYGGYAAADAEDAAERIYELEKRLAEPILRPEDFNDPGNYYNPRPVADLIAANPDFDWPAFLEHPRHPGAGDSRRHRAEVPERG